MKAAIYARVSTDTQDTANQLPELTNWASRLPADIVSTYAENGTAWKAGHQHELARLLDDAARRRFDVVLVWGLDRLTREGPLSILKLIDRLKRCGVRVYSYQEPWTLAPGDIADLLYSITGWVARFESQRRSDRTKAGLARVKAAGKRLGRPAGSKDKRKRRQKRSASAQS